MVRHSRFICLHLAILAFAVSGCAEFPLLVSATPGISVEPDIGLPASVDEPSEAASLLPGFFDVAAKRADGEQTGKTEKTDKPAGASKPKPADTEEFKAPEPFARPPLESGGEDVPYDPFAKEDEGKAVEEYDPWEAYNTKMFEFNRKVDKYVLKPVAEVYEKVVPDELELGIRNFFHNVRFVPRLLNNVLQGKVKGAGLELSRFLINSTVGVAGLFDVAKNYMGLETPDEDLGQTLAVYGVPPGPYLILPFLAPFTLRDAVGYTGDIFLDPINYLLFPSIQVSQPSAIPLTARWTTFWAQTGTRGEEIVNDRSINLETFQGVEEATIDLYGAVRNAYLQKRAKMIKE